MSAREITKDNYLIEAGRIQPDETIWFNRGRLDYPEVAAALAAQYGKDRFWVTRHGNTISIQARGGR